MRKAAVPVLNRDFGALLKVNEAADRLGISRAKIYKMLANAEIGYVRVGADRRIPECEIQAFVARNFVAA